MKKMVLYYLFVGTVSLCCMSTNAQAQVPQEDFESLKALVMEPLQKGGIYSDGVGDLKDESLFEDQTLSPAYVLTREWVCENTFSNISNNKLYESHLQLNLDCHEVTANFLSARSKELLEPIEMDTKISLVSNNTWAGNYKDPAQNKYLMVCAPHSYDTKLSQKYSQPSSVVLAKKVNAFIQNHENDGLGKRYAGLFNPDTIYFLLNESDHSSQDDSTIDIPCVIQHYKSESSKLGFSGVSPNAVIMSYEGIDVNVKIWPSKIQESSSSKTTCDLTSFQDYTYDCLTPTQDRWHLDLYGIGKFGHKEDEVPTEIRIDTFDNEGEYTFGLSSILKIFNYLKDGSSTNLPQSLDALAHDQSEATIDNDYDGIYLYAKKSKEYAAYGPIRLGSKGKETLTQLIGETGHVIKDYLTQEALRIIAAELVIPNRGIILSPQSYTYHHINNKKNRFTKSLKKIIDQSPLGGMVLEVGFLVVSED